MQKQQADQIVQPYMMEEPQNTMEGRARRRASPAGVRTRPARVEPEPPPTKRHELGKTRVAVVYYLCRNHHLEHPHFMEVPLASPQGLYLRDVISRLDALRGKGMAAKYSWSCKRRYKSGFVWHDLSEGDLMLPAQGTEYVLKGSELQFVQSPAAVPVIKEAVAPSPPAAVVSAKEKTELQPALLSSPSASTIGYGEQCRVPHSASSTDSSPKTSTPSSGATSPGLNDPAAAHDAATQTDDKARRDNTKLESCQNTARVTLERPETVDESHSKGRPAGEYPASRRSGTLKSLIRAEAVSRRRGLLEEDDERTATTGSVSGRLKPANLLSCLMACGPHNPCFGLVQNSCKPPFTRLESPSSPELFPLGALKPRTTSASTVAASETENSTGTLLGGVAGKLGRSSSSSSPGHQDGVCGDSVDLSRSTSERMSDPSVVGKDTLSEGSVVPPRKGESDQGGRKKGLLQERGAVVI